MKFIDWLMAQWEKPKVRHYALYLVFGGLTTVLNVGLYAALTRLFNWNETASNVTAVVCSVLFAYLTNKRFVFRAKAAGKLELTREFLSFVGGRAITMAIEIGGFEFLHKGLEMHDMLAKALLTILIIVLNYVISRFFVFVPAKKEEPPEGENGENQE